MTTKELPLFSTVMPFHTAMACLILSMVVSHSLRINLDAPHRVLTNVVFFNPSAVTALKVAVFL